MEHGNRESMTLGSEGSFLLRHSHSCMYAEGLTLNLLMLHQLEMG